jgi:preprotein translocase subunit YajC
MNVFAAADPGNLSFTMIWLVIMIAIFYFLLIRPQKKKEKADRMMRNALSAGDHIVTIGGFVGRVLSVKDDEVTFETGAAKTRLTVKKWAIQTREGAEVAEEETKDADESK